MMELFTIVLSMSVHDYLSMEIATQQFANWINDFSVLGENEVYIKRLRGMIRH
jgi:hypothetical protein